MAQNTREEIMCATYRALCEHGFANLTMQDIADEAGTSKAALHYHYDTKCDLLLAFLEYLFGRFAADLDDVTGDADPAVRLAVILDAALSPRRDSDTPALQTALLELKAQAPFNEAYRERLTAFERDIHGRIRDVIADGVDQGAFASDVDPDTAATFVVTLINGAHTRRAAVGYPLDETRDVLAEYLERRLLANDREGEA